MIPIILCGNMRMSNVTYQGKGRKVVHPNLEDLFSEIFKLANPAAADEEPNPQPALTQQEAPSSPG